MDRAAACYGDGMTTRMESILGTGFDDLLMCRVANLAYDFVEKVGHVTLPVGEHCDMMGCIRKRAPVETAFVD